MKKYAYYAVIILVSVIAVGFVANAFMGGSPKVVVEGNYIEAQDAGDNLGAVSGPDVYGDFRVHGVFRSREFTKAIDKTDVWATTTLTVADSGSTYLLSASGTSIILPAVSTAGVNFKFVINGAATDANFVIDSAEGDNISGTLSVNNADVACDAEDQINFVTDGETIGDYFEIFSDGSRWILGDSGVETAAKLTCTDPS